MTLRYLCALAAAALLTATAAASAQTTQAPPERDFQVRTTSDLVRLCEAKPVDPTGIAALHFCQGFAVGAYQYHQIAVAAEQRRPLFCAPNPPPTRNEAIAGFVAWARQNPNQLNTPPVEGMFRFLAQQYPCRA